MSQKVPTSDFANWNPGAGGVDSDSKKAKLFSTEAHDSAETMNGTNELKRAQGRKTTHKPPFGVKGQMF